MKMVRNLFILFILFGVASMFAALALGYSDPMTLGSVASHYVSKGISELNGVNIVTSVVVTYRGLDTLGEVTVLFLTASVISFFLKKRNSESKSDSSELLQTASKVIFPFIFMTGFYIVMNGHLTPGGGFQGGAVMASALLLLILADHKTDGSPTLFTVFESISGVFYVLTGIAGLIIAGGFLDATILGAGTTGKLLSAGAIPLISTLIGIKVGSELSTMIVKLKNGSEV
jgi:multicomponent Na+:H+ antiporter subunit B